MLGYRRIIIRSDGEPALLSTLREAVAATSGLEAMFRTSPPDDPQANGAAERAVQEVKAHSKVLVADLRGKYPGIDMKAHASHGFRGMLLPPFPGTESWNVDVPRRSCVLDGNGAGRRSCSGRWPISFLPARSPGVAPMLTKAFL